MNCDLLAKWIPDRGNLPNRRTLVAAQAVPQGEEKAGLGQLEFSHILSGLRSPGPDACSAIAYAFNLPEETVFREAGLLRHRIEDTPSLAEAQHLFGQLSDEDQEAFLAQMRAVLELKRVTRNRLDRHVTLAGIWERLTIEEQRSLLAQLRTMVARIPRVWHFRAYLEHQRPIIIGG